MWPKNDDSSKESFPLTYFQSKSCTNLPETEEKKRPPKQKKFQKKCHFGSRNDGIWPKNDEPLTESYLLTHSQLKSCTNLREYEFWLKKNEYQNKNFKKILSHRLKWSNLAEKWWFYEGVLPVDLFPSKSCTNLPETEFWR